jgi:tetratricopeptide (TPR) repeat protein
MQQKGGPGGDLGADRYQGAIARLKRAAPAYAKYDKAMEAAAKKDTGTARSLVNEAIRLEPTESRFYSLLGDLDMMNDNARAALGSFEKARNLDPGYFKPYAQAGVANYKLGNKGQAEQLLSQSMQMLPTAPGAYYLGRVYEDKGQTAEAMRLYRMVAGSKSPLGQDAMQRLARLDLNQNPEAYLAVQPKIDNRGIVWLQVGNRTSVPISDVNILVAVVDPRTGQTAAGPVRVGTGREVILPQQAVNLQTSLGPFTSGEVVNYVRWKVESARPGNP